MFGIRFKIEFSILLLISFALLTGYTNVLLLILFSSLHELGHIMALLLFGEAPDEITVSYYGIGLKHSAKLSAIKEILFLISGVTVNVVFVLLKISPDINLPLAFINSLPLYPLDGGRVLSLILHSFLSDKLCTMILSVITAIFIILILLAAIYFRNVSLLLILLYIIFYSVNMTRYL